MLIELTQVEESFNDVGSVVTWNKGTFTFTRADSKWRKEEKQVGNFTEREENQMHFGMMDTYKQSKHRSSGDADER